MRVVVEVLKIFIETVALERNVCDCLKNKTTSFSLVGCGSSVRKLVRLSLMPTFLGVQNNLPDVTIES